MFRYLSAALIGLALAAPPASAEFIIVQSTTSTQNSGLYDYLLPIFTGETGVEVRVVAVGTGQAIKNAQNGDGDVLLAHSTPDEMAFVADGYGVRRFDLMYNDFVVVGPKSDPAGIGGSTNVVEALKKIADAQAPFASRGDDSGTHKKEKSLWAAAEVTPGGGWYLETGSGMGATLNVGSGMGAYALTDRATWIKFANKGDLAIAVEGDKRLFNQYGVMLVNPGLYPAVKAEAGQTFIDWLLSEHGQKVIADYRVDGQPMFFPNAKTLRAGD